MACSFDASPQISCPSVGPLPSARPSVAVSLQDVVLAAVDWRIAYEDRWDLDPSFSLDDLRGVGDFEQEVAARARRWAASSKPTADQGQQTSAGPDARLVDETAREQAAGDASSPTEKW